MEFEKISSPSLRELFVQQLEQMILSGNLPVGEKLPPERQLAQEMQVSRAVVNGGISDLEKKGFLVVKPRSGTYVADYRRNGFGAEAVRGMLDFGFRKLDLSVIAAWVHAANIKSARVLEKCGFTLEGRLRRHGRDRGDTLCYSILSEEFLN